MGHRAGIALLGADVVDDRDVRVVERRRGPRLLLEASQPFGIRRVLGRQHLDRHLATEACVLAQVDVAHTSGADLFDDFVGTETLTYQRAGSYQGNGAAITTDRLIPVAAKLT